MSVTLTKDAVIERRKTETRRGGWTMLRPGDRLTLCEKVMGRKAGEPLVRIVDVEVVATRREPLNAITDDAVAREGFTAADLREFLPLDWPARGALARAFVAFFTKHMGGAVDQEVTVITWRYLDTAADSTGGAP
ncbi:ASCH domain-containing protein [Pimelobacter simplex]|nr:ASCH domain-containing protein [Pimelobacter simplex]MCG8150219.1 ASCH domain-containing protein [Pimelobacter simplex]